ncbi:MAG: hypothetical protein D6734_01925 [Candidatus Schekmanbacteria bacterium]|nr:MAG: hypothetical protein D6734_01925 [Candidatus Schekmanbacteria bacterium]
MKQILSYLKKIPILFIVVFLIYNLNLREISAGDTIPAKYIPISILTEFDLDLDEFPYLYNSPGNKEYLFIQKTEKGHWYSSYPVVPGIIALPIYAPAILSGMKINPKHIDILAKVSASVIAVFSVIFIFMTLKFFVDEDTAFLWAVVYAFATSTWSVSSQGLWQHGPVELFISMGIYFFVKDERRKGNFILSSLSFSLAVATRMPTAIIAASVFIYVLMYHRKKIITFILPALLVAIMLFSYNIYHFGNLFGGNDLLEKKMLITKGIPSIWTLNFLPGLAGLLVSPSRGIVVFSPVLIFSFLSFYHLFKDREKIFFKYIAFSALAYILLFSFYRSWWAGHTFGYRYLIDIIPILCIVGAFYSQNFISKKWLKAIFILFLVLSIFVQILGAFNYPAGWNNIPQNIDKSPERNWDFLDNQILRCIKKGARYPLFLRKDY